MAQEYGVSREELVRALLAQRRQNTSAPGVAAAAEKQARVQQLLLQRRMAKSAGTAGLCKLHAVQLYARFACCILGASDIT